MAVGGIEYKETFVESFMGNWIDNCKTVMECFDCKQRMRVPINKGNLKVTCPKCNQIILYSPHLLLKKCLGFLLLLIGGILSGILIGYLNHFYNITGFYLFFIIPAGAVALGLAANTGFVGTLAFLRMKGINYSMLFLVIMSGSIALFTFWLSQYIVYSTETIKVNYVSLMPPPEIKHTEDKLKQIQDSLQNLRASIDNYSKEIQRIKSMINRIERNAESGFIVDQEEYERLISKDNGLVSTYNINVKAEQKLYINYKAKHVELNALVDKFNRGEIGEEDREMKREPISSKYTFINYIRKMYGEGSFRMFGIIGKVPLATPSVDIKMGLFGLIFLMLEQIGLFFALPAIWLLTNMR